MIDPQPPNERRRFHRIVFDAPTSIRLHDIDYAVRLLDVSLKGALVEIPAADWPLPSDSGHEVTLSIDLDEGACRIAMQGRIAHQEGKCVGIQCLHIDMDSITHLRRLVELNLGDPEMLERELAALG